MHVKMKFKFFSCFGHTFSLLHTWPPTVVQNQFFGPSFCKIYFTAKSYLAGLSFFLQSHEYQYEVLLITQLWQKYWVYYPIWQNRYMKGTCLVLFPLHILVCSVGEKRWLDTVLLRKCCRYQFHTLIQIWLTCFLRYP